MLALYATPTIINFKEAGDNVLRYALELSKNYNMYVYFDRVIITKEANNNIVLVCNNKQMTCRDYNNVVGV